MSEMNRTLRVFHVDGTIENMKCANEYHAQNILSLLFTVLDEHTKNDIVFAELLGSKIFAWKDTGKRGITIRNATDQFLEECNELNEESSKGADSEC